MTLHDYADLPFDMTERIELRGPKQAKLVIEDADENEADPHHVE